MWRRSQYLDKTKYKVGDVVGVPTIDDDGNKIYLEGRVDEISNVIERGVPTFMYFTTVTEDNDFIPQGKGDWYRENDLAAEATPMEAMAKNLGQKK